MQFNYKEADPATATHANHKERRQKLFETLKSKLEMTDLAEYDDGEFGTYFIRGLVPDAGALSAQLAQHEETKKLRHRILRRGSELSQIFEAHGFELLDYTDGVMQIGLELASLQALLAEREAKINKKDAKIKQLELTLTRLEKKYEMLNENYRRLQGAQVAAPRSAATPPSSY